MTQCSQRLRIDWSQGFEVDDENLCPPRLYQDQSITYD